MEVGFVLLLVAIVIGVPAWFCRGIGNRLRERVAPVEARSTTVVLDSAPPAAPERSLLPLIRTVEGGGRRYGITRDGASGMGYDPHAQDAQDAHAHDGHGDGL
jgi:hypothetical protein